MSANGSVCIAGMLTYAGDQDQGVPVALAQVLAQVETKKYTLYVPPTSTVTANLLLSTGVVEALFVCLYAPAAVVVQMTTSDSVLPGPQNKGLLGLALWTFTPGEGLAALTVTNKDPINGVSMTVLLAAAQEATTTPPFWVVNT